MMLAEEKAPEKAHEISFRLTEKDRRMLNFRAKNLGSCSSSAASLKLNKKEANVARKLVSTRTS